MGSQVMELTHSVSWFVHTSYVLFLMPFVIYDVTHYSTRITLCPNIHHQCYKSNIISLCSDEIVQGHTNPGQHRQRDVQF